VTDRPVTISDRLMSVKKRYWTDTLANFADSELPFGKDLREDIVDPLILSQHAVVWRNYEASYEVQALEPLSRTHSTYVLQEYFVPVKQFNAFVPKMRRILRQHDVNVINVSIRHAYKDSGSLLAWAKAECFSFVIYYKQGVREKDKAEVGIWARELIEAALSVGGSYY
jgi:hypothetical protein